MTAKDTSQEPPREWRLVGRLERDGVIWRTPVRPLPFTIGRRPDAQLRLRSGSVSLEHARIVERSGELVLVDLGSTNGSFVNGDAVTGERVLANGDILHFADQEFKLQQVDFEATQPTQTLSTTRIPRSQPELAPRAVREIREFLQTLSTNDDSIQAEFQAVVKPGDRSVVGYEALGRVRRRDLPELPIPLFSIAERLGQARTLSRAMRLRALEQATRLPALGDGAPPAVFINTHPLEISDCRELVDDLAAFRSRHPDWPLVVEIHESAVSDVVRFAELKRELDRLGIQQAFDDFGSGEARLRELCDASPHYVKFDQTFARGLDADERRRHLVVGLLRTMADLRIATVLEGVETESEARWAAELGFNLAQGYHYALPTSADRLAAGGAR